MIVTKEGIYKSVDGNLYDVINCQPPSDKKPYFRAYWQGSYYNVNNEPDNFPFDEIEIEMIEYVGPLKKD